MTAEQHLQNAAREYLSSTGFEPQQYNQSAGQPIEARLDAMRADVRWFQDHAEEAMLHTSKHLCAANAAVEENVADEQRRGHDNAN